MKAALSKINRHGDFDAIELYRLLKNDSMFIGVYMKILVKGADIEITLLCQV